MKKHYLIGKLLLFFLSFIFTFCKKDEIKQSSIETRKIKTFVSVQSEHDTFYNVDTIKKFEYRTGTSGSYKYNYDVFGKDNQGKDVLGNITVDGKYGKGIIFYRKHEKIYVNVEWIGYGKLKAIDSLDNEYLLEVVKD